MNNLLILGAGQYSYVIEDIARQSGRFQNIHCLDDTATLNQRIIGRIADLQSLRATHSYALVAIGNPAVRREFIDRLLAFGYTLPTLVSPLAWVSTSASLGDACIVEPGAVINANAQIGTACLVCAGAVINHNATVGDFCQIDCNATIPARATVPDDTKVPCGAVFE